LASKFKYSYNKPSSNSKLGSPKDVNYNKNSQVLATASMLSLFRDMSNKVSAKLQNKQQSLTEIYDCKKSTASSSQNNLKLSQKRAMIPPSGRLHLASSKEK